MNSFENRTLDKSINAAIITANEMLNGSSKMMLELSHKNDFKFNSGDGETVWLKIVNYKGVTPVFFYKPFNPWTSAMGYSDGKAIYLNSRKFDSFTFSDLVGLLLHEKLHIIGFGHGNNYKTSDKCLYSVNYFVSENVRKWLWTN